MEKKAFLLLNYLSIASIASACITPGLPLIKEFYHLTQGDLGWMITIFLVGYLLGQILFGPLSNQIGRISALRLGFYINFLGLSICLLSYYLPFYSIMLVGRFINALGASAGLVLTFILINETYSKKQARSILSYAILSFTGGITVSILVGGYLTQYLGWQYVFIFLAVHSFVLFYLTRYLQETLVKKTDSQSRFKAQILSTLVAFKHIRLIAFSIIFAQSSIMSYAYSLAAPLISIKYLGLSPYVYGNWNALNIVGMLLAGFTAIKFIQKFGGKKTIGIGIFLSALSIISLLIFALTKNGATAWFFASTSLFYFAVSLTFSSSSFYASNCIEDKAGASSVMNFINLCGACLSVIVVGYLPFSPIYSFILGQIIFTALILLMFVLIKNQTNKIDQPEH